MSSLTPVAGAILLSAGFLAGALVQERPASESAPVVTPVATKLPDELVEGVMLVQMVITSGQSQPHQLLVERVEGEWLQLQVMKGRTRKGSPYWVHIEEIGAFRIEKPRRR